MAFGQPSRLAGRLGGWVVRGWERVGHPSLLRSAVIRHPSGSDGLLELYAPLIIHLGYTTLGQAHKGLIYPPAGNERTWDAGARIRERWPGCQQIELMDRLQRHSTLTTTLAFSTLSWPANVFNHHVLSSSWLMVFLCRINTDKIHFFKNRWAHLYFCAIVVRVSLRVLADKHSWHFCFSHSWYFYLYGCVKTKRWLEVQLVGGVDHEKLKRILEVEGWKSVLAQQKEVVKK